MVPEHGDGRRQLQRSQRRRPGVLDERRRRRRRVRQVPDGHLGRQRRSRRDDGRGRPHPDLPGAGRARRPDRPRLRGCGGELQRGCLEGRLGRRRRLRRSGRRRPDGHDLPHRHLRAVRPHGAHDVGRARDHRPGAQGCRRTGLRELRGEPARHHHGVLLRQRRRAVHLRPRERGRDRDQPQQPRDQGGPGLLGRPRRQGTRRHGRPVHPRVHRGRDRRRLRHLPVGRVGSGIPPGRGRRRGRGCRCVGGRPHAAVGPGQPDLDQLGRLGLRGEQPGVGPRARRQGGVRRLRRPGIAG